jgi:hypothetical protein
MAWSALMLVGSLCFLQLTGMTWNPRYFLFFMPALWILAAYAMERVAHRFEYRSAAAAWYGCVVRSAVAESAQPLSGRIPSRLLGGRRGA